MPAFACRAGSASSLQRADTSDLVIVGAARVVASDDTAPAHGTEVVRLNGSDGLVRSAGRHKIDPPASTTGIADLLAHETPSTPGHIQNRSNGGSIPGRVTNG